MRQYERYLLMHLLLPSVLVTAGLTGIIWLTQVMRFIDYMLNRGLSIGDFFYLGGLMLPNLLLVLIPISLGIAVVYTYNRLTSDSELVVLNAVGVSKLQLARPAVVVGFGAALLCYALSLYFMPVANTKFRDVRSFFRDKYASVLLEEEVFNTPVDGITVFIRSRDAGNNLYGILLHDNRDPQAPITMMADRGRMEQAATGPRFYLEHGVRQQMRNGRVDWLSFDNYAIDIAFYAKDIDRERGSSERMLGELLRGDPDHPQENNELHAEAHQRLTWPLFAISLPLLALSIVLAGEFNRRGQARRTVQAAIAMAACVLVYFGLRGLIVKQPWAAPAMYLEVVGMVIVSIQLLSRGALRRVKNRPALEAMP